MKISDIVIIDVETSGPDVFKNDLLSLYMCSVDSDSSIDLYIKHESEIRWGSVGKRYFNQYKNTWEEKSQDAILVLTKLNEFLDSHTGNQIVLSGHNVAFDYYFLKSFAYKYKVKLSEKLSHRLIDTHSIIALKVMQGLMPQYTLKPQGAAEYYGISTENRHSAKYDALLSKEILIKLLSEFPESIKINSLQM